MWRIHFILVLFLFSAVAATAQKNGNKFKQLKEELPTPNVYRTASGAPGPNYWQQRADYDMSIRLDDEQQRIYGEETITYYNNSPDELNYLWLQLDQNMRAQDSDTRKTATNEQEDMQYWYYLSRLHLDFDGGFKIEQVKDRRDQDLSYTINNTMMRVDLPDALKPGEKYVFKVKWWYNINDGATYGGRSGYEYFPEEDNYMYSIAQFYPRMAVYNDVEGWQNKQFLGRGEFALEFGDFKVAITVPSDHVVASTGELQNPSDVLTATQRQRLNTAKTADEPVMIITEEEAKENEVEKATGTKTWVYEAENVRDFAFASSRKFMWDAQGVQFGDRTVMAMSYYPKEGLPLWDRYSTRATVHTLKVYSRYTFEYPYPVAISTHAKFTGMEYPMICFNFGRPRPDGTYSERTKYGMIGVVIHEVGHNYFPMIVNSDERQWTWMDEGLNSFLEYLTEEEWERDFPSRRGPAPNIVEYMKGDKDGIVPIMTNSESILQFGNNAYGKPATALNILRETIMGRELFDFAFKEYSKRWMFKHPTPADFFRTMEDASAVDLDWFWRGWFYTVDHVDIALKNVQWFRMNTADPEKEMAMQKELDANDNEYISEIRNRESVEETVMEKNPELRDEYNDRDKYRVTNQDRAVAQSYLSSLTEEERAIMEEGYNYYELQFENEGGLVMPIILEFQFTDGTKEVQRIPAEIWRYNNKKVSKVFFFKKEVKEIVLDPFLETADTDRSDNYYPPRTEPTRFQLFKGQF